ncbi:MAG TPA: cytidylate kinase-like family protein [Prolixibacteraceae bacterium]|nr:cytidylate kinase-like family protein [Prolixibacteraceae bacterium]
MEDILYKYMSQRFKDKIPNEEGSSLGPVITISRAAGCSTSKLVEELTFALNHNGLDDKWEIINKDILRHSAELLNLQPEKVESIFKMKKRKLFDEVVQTFISSDYHLEKKMIKTVTKVIHQFGAEGHKIIVGRAANIICADIPRALHIRIDAPIQWQIEHIEKKKNFTKEEALSYITLTEQNRENFRKTIKGSDQLNVYDLVINQATFNTVEIISIITNALSLKNIL